MWAVCEITTRVATLDFTSSEQGKHEVTQVVADGVLFANAAGYSSWNDANVQVHICEDCGFEGCASGGWLTARDVGVGVAFIPVFDEMLGGDWERTNYGPPRFPSGSPVFPPDGYAQLQHCCPGLPPLNTVPALTGADVVRCLQWEGVEQVLGPGAAELERAAGASRARFVPGPSTSTRLAAPLSGHFVELD